MTLARGGKGARERLRGHLRPRGAASASTSYRQKEAVAAGGRRHVTNNTENRHGEEGSFWAVKRELVIKSMGLSQCAFINSLGADEDVCI